MEWVWEIQAGGLFLLTIISFFPKLFHLEEILFFVLFGLAIFAGWLEGQTFKVQTSIDYPLLLLLAWVLLTIPFSVNPEYSFAEWRKLVAQCLVFYWAVYIIREISQKPSGERAGLPFAWLEYFRNQSTPQKVFLGVLLGAFLLSAFALPDFIERGGNWQDRDIRAKAPGSDYNWLSTYLVISIPIVFYYGITARLLKAKFFSYGTLALGLLAHAASYTRAGWLAFAAQLFSWGCATRRRHFIFGFLLVILLVSVALVGIARTGYQADTLHTWTLETRLQVWKLGLDQIVSHPLVGIGYGNNNFRPILVDSPMGDKPMHLHNTLLMMGVGSGIPGLVFFLWVFIRLGKEFFPMTHGGHLTDSEALKLCLGIVVVGFFCRNLFDYMFIGSLGHLFWILMACGFEVSWKCMPMTGQSYPHGAIRTKGDEYY